MGGARTKVLIATLLAVVTTTVYWPATSNDFVFDDRHYLLTEKHFLGGLSGKGFVWAFASSDLSLYVPLARLSAMLDFQLYGSNPFGHHLTSLLIHGAVCVLIFLALEALTGALWKSTAVAALCAVHPLRVEPVAWISGRADLLAALFGFLALLAWVHYLRRRSVPWAMVAVGSFLLGMLSKPIVMTLPFVLLLLDFWPLGRVRPTASADSGAVHDLKPGRVREIAALFREKSWLFLATAVLVGVSLYILQRGPMVVSAEKYPFSARVVTSLISYATYVKKTIWPADLAVIYPHRWGAFPWWEWGGAALLLVVLSGAAVLAARRRPYLAVGWIWFLGTLLPVIGIFQARLYPVADRYMYFPQIGLFVMAVWGLEDVGRGRRRGKALASVAVLAPILICVPVSLAQVRHWKDDYTLFSHAVAVTKDNWLAHSNFGTTLRGRGELERAYAEFVRARVLHPGSAENRYNLGIVLIDLKRYREAAVEFEAALRISPDSPRSHNNYAVALVNLGRLDEAVYHFRRAIFLNPKHDGAYINLGQALLKRGNREEAVGAFREAVRINPDSVRARQELRALEGGM
jgi:Tfp pilus assembly protein PilF